MASFDKSQWCVLTWMLIGVEHLSLELQEVDGCAIRVGLFCIKKKKKIYIYIYNNSESRGQERAKGIAKNKIHNKLLCVFYPSECFSNMTS